MLHTFSLGLKVLHVPAILFIKESCGILSFHLIFKSYVCGHLEYNKSPVYINDLTC